MEIVIDTHLLWNLMITFVLAPLGFLIRNLLSEQKRIDILVNKTREELAKDYVTREQIEIDFERILSSIQRIDEKIDRLQSKTYFQE
jgi:endonuclease III